MIKKTLRKGLGFGLTSGTITTIGLMVGLYSTTNSKLAVIGGILTIAIADSFSDALGMHVSEEFESKKSAKEVWEATFFTLIFKFIFSSIFIIPILIFELPTAIFISALFGLFVIGIFSFKFAKEQNNKPWKSVVEHLLIASLVIFLTYHLGYLINLILDLN